MTVSVFKERHGYEIDGVWFPRVTSITALANGFSFPGAARLSGKVYGFQQAAEWGSQVHEAIERILRGEQAEFDARMAVSIETFVRWRARYPFSVANPAEDIERRVLDLEEGYAGTVDIVAEVEGVLSIIDLKTSVALTREYGMQTAAYMNAYNKMKPRPRACKKRWILRLDQYRECRGCLAKIREKYGRARVAGGVSANSQACNHQWSESKGEVEFCELTAYERDLDGFFALKERWEWVNKEWLSQIPNYEKHIRQYTIL